MSDDKGPPDIIVGSGVWLRATTYDLGQSPPELFDPGDGVNYYLLDPLDTVRVNGLAMDNVGTGQYQAWYQTEDDDPLGRWLWAAQSVNGLQVVKTPAMVAFITKADVFA